MVKEKWHEEAEDLINQVLDLKEKAKQNKEDLDGAKVQLAELLQKHEVNHYSGENGKCNFVRFEREGLIKDNVLLAVDSVNKGQIKRINMRDLTKDIKVCFINVRGYI